LTNLLKIASFSVSKSENQTIGDFLNQAYSLIQNNLKLHPDLDIIIFPEYVLNREPIDINYLKNIIGNWELLRYPNIVFGTVIVKNNDKKYNCILLFDTSRNLHLIAKLNPMQNERNNGVLPIEDPLPEGFSSNVINLNLNNGKQFKFGFVICSDIWQGPLIRSIVNDEAGCLIIPSMTSTLPGYGNYAKYLWYALVITRAREYVIPIVVADNPQKKENFETGHASMAVDPSIKHENIEDLEDFLLLPDQNGIIIAEFDLDKIEEYRQYRIKQGLRKI
jgi:predicted amidohydrolase